MELDTVSTLGLQMECELNPVGYSVERPHFNIHLKSRVGFRCELCVRLAVNPSRWFND
jgi:hypothetical protein